MSGNRIVCNDKLSGITIIIIVYKNCFMKKCILLLLPVFFSLIVSAQKPCSSPEYRQFDFWVGDWEAFGKKGQKAGDSKISFLLDSCSILEEWTSASIQKGLRYAGKSYNSYNAATKKWQQYHTNSVLM